MNKTCLLAVCLVLLGLAPATFAADDMPSEGFAGLFAQLVAVLTGIDANAASPIELPNQSEGEAEIGEQFPPGGIPSSDKSEASEIFPPHG